MLFAVLEFSDFAVIGLLILIFAGGGAAASAYRRPADRDRLQLIEHKVDLILTHLGIDYIPPPKAAWQELADDPAHKIAAIKAYREQHDVGLAEAKQAVEDYIEGKSKQV
jgi:hypothetical protein